MGVGDIQQFIGTPTRQGVGRSRLAGLVDVRLKAEVFRVGAHLQGAQLARSEKFVLPQRAPVARGCTSKLAIGSQRRIPCDRGMPPEFSSPHRLAVIVAGRSTTFCYSASDRRRATTLFVLCYCSSAYRDHAGCRPP